MPEHKFRDQIQQTRNTYDVKISQAFTNDLHRLLQILLINNQGWSKADATTLVSFGFMVKETNLHVDVSWLSQHASALQQQTELPRSPSSRALLLINDDSIQQASSPDALHQW